MNYTTSHTKSNYNQPDISELIFNNQFTSYQIGYTSINEIHKELTQTGVYLHDSDHRSYLQEFYQD